MTHRERFTSAIMHYPVDRAVFDLCGSPQTLVDYQITKNDLARLLGINNPKHGVFRIDERILTALEIDTRLIGCEPTPTSVHNRVENGVIYDSWGIGRREVNGHYEICVSPLMDCSIDEMMAFVFPDPENVDRNLVHQWAEHAKFLHEETDYAIIAGSPMQGTFELGCWMFGFDDYLYRLAAEPETVHAFSARVFRYQKRMIEIYYGAVGRYIDATTSGDDFGMQTGSFMSAAMFDEYIKPYLTARVTYTRQYTDGFFKHHTCGSVYNLIPSLINCGVDILNPIQPGAYQMLPEQLKADFGDKLAFWGGIDTQYLLPKGTVGQVKNAVKQILSVMDKNGGYVLSPAHTIQYDVSAENIIAIYEGAEEYYCVNMGDCH